MDKIISIIIPAYNVEKYIGQGIESFLADHGIINDIELLIINDGSRDKTKIIADTFAQEYPDIVRVINKENGGHGSTINRGIQEAKGRYFKVVDGDDWVESEQFPLLVRFLKSTDADLVISPFYSCDNNSLQKTIVDSFKNYDGQYNFNEICSVLPRIQMHGMTIKTDILRKNRIQLQEHLFYVDVEYTCFPVPYINTIEFLKTPIYVYRVGTDEQSMNRINLWKRRNQHLKVLHHLIDFYRNLDTVPEKKEYLRRAISEMADTQYMILLSGPVCKKTKKELISFDNCLKQASREIYNSTKVRRIIVLRKCRFIIYRWLHVSR